VAAKLGASSGQEVLMAAAATLVICKGMERFTRQELLNEMKSACGYYKASFRRKPLQIY
jgi:hypothetical protein